MSEDQGKVQTSQGFHIPERVYLAPTHLSKGVEVGLWRGKGGAEAGPGEGRRWRKLRRIPILLSPRKEQVTNQKVRTRGWLLLRVINTVADAEEFGQLGVRFKCTHFSKAKKMGFNIKEQRIYHQRTSGRKAEETACKRSHWHTYINEQTNK